MNGMGFSEPGTRIFWTRQAAAIEEELEKNGIYRAKKEYIEKKNDTISEFYLRLYRWYTKEAAKYIETSGEYPIWLSLSEDNMLQPVEGTVILEVEIPADRYLLCNYDAWGYIVNYFYVPLDEADRVRHTNELRRYGIGSDDELLLTNKGNFYPLLKREVQQSWSRAFTLKPGNMEMGLVATAWEIRKEWVREIRHYLNTEESK